MGTAKIMIVRHAEKPSDDGSVTGVSPQGSEDGEDLTVRGWQRSGALVRFFASPSNAALTKPDVIFASGVAKHSNSLRPQHTIAAVAQFLQITPNLGHAKGDEAGLVKEAVSVGGRVLIAWEHEAIPLIGNLIVGNSTAVPQNWPGDRFDLVWVLDRTANDATWTFTQIPQMLLPGDKQDR